MKKYPILLAILVTGGLAACSASTSDGTEHPTQQETDDPVQHTTDGSASDQGQGEDQAAGGEPSQSDDTQDSDSDDQTSASETEDSEDQSDSAGSSEDSIDDEQKQMAIDTLNDLVSDGKKGKVYKLTDQFYVGKTTQTDVYNAIGKPERQDAFDRYTGSMGRASYDLRYDKSGLLVEARYLGTNVERQTNLGGITSNDLVEQLGDPDEQHNLKGTDQTSFIYVLGDYEIQFIMGDDDKADHVNLLLVS